MVNARVSAFDAGNLATFKVCVGLLLACSCVVGKRYRGRGEQASAEARSQLFTSHTDTDIVFTDSRSEWLSRLNDTLDLSTDQPPPPPLPKSDSKPASKASATAPKMGPLALSPAVQALRSGPGGISLSSIKDLILADKVQALMYQAHVLQFGVLCSFLETSNPAEVLQVLEQHAWLVGGGWVVKSTLVCPEIAHLNQYGHQMHGRTTDAGSGGAVFTRTRDLILLKFYQGEKLTLKPIVDETGVAPNDARDILQRLAVYRCVEKATELGAGVEFSCLRTFRLL